MAEAANHVTTAARARLARRGLRAAPARMVPSARSHVPSNIVGRSCGALGVVESLRLTAFCACPAALLFLWRIPLPSTATPIR
jgi:hypothetical protein